MDRNETETETANTTTATTNNDNDNDNDNTMNNGNDNEKASRNPKQNSRKRSRKDERGEPTNEMESGTPKSKSSLSLSSSARRRNRKKRQKTKPPQASSDATMVNHANPKKPLAGLVVSVSTLKDKTKTKRNTDNDETDNDTSPSMSMSTSMPVSYNEVCRTCRELGAEVIDLVCKRVSLVVCTEAAVKQATQRVRKAIKRKKPLVSVEWLEECKKRGRRVAMDAYLLDQAAEDVVHHRKERLLNAPSSGNRVDDDDEFGSEPLPDSGWSEPQELGCCCVCHENGTTADCPWCVDCNV